MRLLVVGGSDAGIAAALRAREIDPSVEVTVALADTYPELTVDPLSDLDLSYAPPFGSPWDALQLAAQAWTIQGLGNALNLRRAEELEARVTGRRAGGA